MIKTIIQKGNAHMGLGQFDEAKQCYESLRVRVKESILFFAKDVAPRWASNHGPFHGNYKDKYTSP